MITILIIIIGKSLKEAQFINKSLAALGLVILKLERGQKHVSYRDSKLTYLLQNSLGGNSKTVFIANVSESMSYASETNSTLGFAYRAKSIKNKVACYTDLLICRIGFKNLSIILYSLHIYKHTFRDVLYC